MPEWTGRQIHDTVAAIANQPAYAQRRSLLGRTLSYLMDRLADLFRGVHGSVNARVIILLAAAAIVFVVIARLVVERRMAEAKRNRAGARIRAGERIDFRAAADEAARDGRLLEACHLLHAAVLDALVRSGSVKWDPSRTNGDYVRELRRRGSPLHAVFRAFVGDLERVVFGMREVSADDYTRLRAAAALVVDRRAAA